MEVFAISSELLLHFSEFNDDRIMYYEFSKTWGLSPKTI